MIVQSTKVINGVSLETPRLIDPPPYAVVGDAPKNLAVVCVWWGDLYGVEYVEKLRDAVARNLSIPYEMFCITDRLEAPEGIITVPANNLEGWWQKVNMFKPGILPNNTRILYLDLDVVISGSLDPIACSEGELVMIENYGPNKRHSAFNSSCMVWTPSEKTERIYTCFSDEVIQALHGDQCWIWRAFPNIKAFKKDLVESYKYNSTPWKRSSKNTAVWVFHGNPKPHQVKNKLTDEHWK